MATRRPRLLIVGPLPPPIGGVETVTQAILESSAFAGFDVAHCDTTKGRPKQTQGRFDAGNLAWALRHFTRLAHAVARVRPDVVYLPVAGTWSGFLRDGVLAWIAKRSGARVIGHIHGSDFHDVLGKRGPSARIVRAALAQFDRLLVLGERWRRLVVAYGARADCAIVPSTLRREVFDRGAGFTRAPRREGTIEGLLVGQIGRRKGVFDLLHAVARVRAAALPFHLTLVGPDEYPGEREALVALARELGLETAVEFTGPLQGDALYARYRAADLFVLPSWNEGLPVVLHEAGAFELPVITTPVGAIPDLVRDGCNGLLVTPGDVEGLAAAITRLATGHEERARMGSQLRADIVAFHPDRVCERIACNVRETLAKRDR